MSFRVDITDIESCDKCNVAGQPETPLLVIDAKTDGVRHVIFIHERCLQMSIDKAKKKAAKES